MCIRVYIYIYIHVYTCIYIYIYVYIYIYTYIYIYVYIIYFTYRKCVFCQRVIIAPLITSDVANLVCQNHSSSFTTTPSSPTLSSSRILHASDSAGPLRRVFGFFCGGWHPFSLA